MRGHPRRGQWEEKSEVIPSLRLRRGGSLELELKVMGGKMGTKDLQVP